MRTVAFILSVFVATLLLIGAATLVVLRDGDSNPVWVFVAIIAMMMFVYGPLTLGSFLAYWDVAHSAESRRYFRRVLLVVIGLEVVAAIVTVFFAALSKSGVLIPAVFIGGGVLLTIGALLVGPALYRYDLAHGSPTPAWVAIEPNQIRKRIVATAITFVGVLVLGILALGLVSALVDKKLDAVLLFSFALEFALIVSGGVCIFSTMGWNRRIRDVTDRDPVRLRRVARVVIRKKQIDLDDRDLVAAARYAAVISITMSFQLAYILLLYAGIVLQQVTALQDGIANEFSIAIIVGLVAVLVFLLPLQVTRIRRARRYARDHAAIGSALASES